MSKSVNNDVSKDPPIEVGQCPVTKNNFLLALITMMMTFVYRAEDDWIGWPCRELLPAGHCCYSNKCHERTATDLSLNLQTLTMVNHQKVTILPNFKDP